MTHDDLVQAIRDYCEETGTRPEEARRDAVRAWLARKGQAWGQAVRWAQARAEAAQGAADSVPVETIPPRHRLRGVSTLVDADGNAVMQWVKTAAIPESQEEVLARLLRDLPATVPVRNEAIPAPEGPTRDDLLAVYPIGDPHIGLLAWGRETGADFDLEIARDLMTRAIRDLVLRGPRAGTAIVAPLGDTLHFDNAAHHTTKGDHALDVDGRTAKVLRAAMDVIVTMVDTALEHHDRVVVDPQGGNHDGYTALMLAIGLDAYYRNEPRIRVLIDPAVRHYHRFGRCLIATTHGDKGKLEDLGAIMAAERPRDWGETSHRHWLVGHVHHSQVKEYRGVTVETFRTLAARDSWHAGQGYYAGRDMRRIVYHREHGEVSREIVNVGMLISGQ